MVYLPRFSNALRLYNNDLASQRGQRFMIIRREVNALVCTGLIMAKRALTFAIFVACFLLAISDDTVADGLKRFRNENTDARQHSPANREKLRARKILHKLIGNNEDKSDSSSRIQYIRGLFDLRSRSANPKASVDDSMVSSEKFDIGHLRYLQGHLKRFLSVEYLFGRSKSPRYSNLIVVKK